MPYYIHIINCLRVFLLILQLQSGWAFLWNEDSAHYIQNHRDSIGSRTNNDCCRCRLKVAKTPIIVSQDYDHWHVFKAANHLECNGIRAAGVSNKGNRSQQSASMLVEMTLRVISILKMWGEHWAGDEEWQGLLNKSTLLHEVEESICALAPLCEWLNCVGKDSSFPITIVDVCCGKGVFSMLASYIFQNDDRIDKIIMLDKAPNLHWDHIKAANAVKDGRPLIDTWERCNLHETDMLIERLESQERSLAMVGLHLCKTLSPTLIGIVNVLGHQKCPFMCLAPCCLPRVVFSLPQNRNYETNNQLISVLQYESFQDRKQRNEANYLRQNAMKRASQYNCYLCQSSDHRVHQCQLLPPNVDERMDIFQRAAKAAPCWKCGKIGHFKEDCPSNQQSGKPSLAKPPVVTLDVSSVMSSKDPFESYCNLLSSSVQRENVNLIDTGLVNSAAQHDGPNAKNWNRCRKSIYIIAT